MKKSRLRFLKRQEAALKCALCKEDCKVKYQVGRESVQFCTGTKSIGNLYGDFKKMRKRD